MSNPIRHEFFEPLDLRGLVALERTSRRGSISAAAADLGWSHPTADHHLAKLERILETQLLVRERRGSRLTPAGEFTLARGAEILVLAQNLIADVRTAQHDASHVIRVATIPTLSAVVIPPLEAELSGGNATGERGDVIGLEVTIDDNVPILSSVSLGHLDLGLIVGNREQLTQSGERLNIESVCTEPVYLCVARTHPLVEAFPDSVPPLELLADARWAFGIDKHDVVDAGLRRLCAVAGFSPKVGIRTDDFHTIQLLVAQGVVASLVPHSGLENHEEIHSWQLPEHLLVREILLISRFGHAESDRFPDRLGTHEAVVARVRDALREITGAMLSAEK